LAFTYCTKNPAAKKAATSSCGRYNISEITSANAFYSKIAADRKVEPPIPHSLNPPAQHVMPRWGVRSIKRCDHMSLQGRWSHRCFGSAGFSLLLEYKVKILEKHRFRFIQSLVSGHTEAVPDELQTVLNKVSP
jgi:hypothetical protein